MSYQAPIDDMIFALTGVADLNGVAALPGFEEATPDLVEAVLTEAGKFAGDILAPLNRQGDEQGSRHIDGKVVTPDGWKEAYSQFVDGGWNGIGFPAERGGMGLPWTVATPVQEMWHASNMSFGLCPLLTQGAIEAIELHATPELKNAYLPKMITGEWTGTMNLTEPQAGSDLAAIKSRAVPEGDHYKISGQKIYITYGDHDMTDNIVHLVLARLPDAPEGVKGISLFIVPKFMLDENGEPGERNDVSTVSIEHKLGIHGSPTCVLSFGDEGGATGYLVGEENRGLIYMFTMMNMARHAVAVEGVAIAERAYQQAVAYAKDRVQGLPIGFEAPESGQSNPKPTIIHHPDVKRMLGRMKCQVEAMRALCCYWASLFDKGNRLTDDDERQAHFALTELLTPVVKGWCTEIGNLVTSLGVQIHGGMGFIEETGAAQHYRDARITTIYEGTTGIQASDLIGRKILRDQGVVARAFIEKMGELDASFDQWDDTELDDVRAHLAQGLEELTTATQWVLETGSEDPAQAMAVSVPYLTLWGTVVGGWLMAKMALQSREQLAEADENANAIFLKNKIKSTQFYALHVMTEAAGLATTVTEGGAVVMALEVEHF